MGEFVCNGVLLAPAPSHLHYYARFGENDVLKKITWFQSIRRRLSRQWKVSIALFRGQKCTVMPYRVPITVVMGRPLQVVASFIFPRPHSARLTYSYLVLSHYTQVPKVAEEAITPGLVDAYLDKYLVRGQDKVEFELHPLQWIRSSLCVQSNLIRNRCCVCGCINHHRLCCGNCSMKTSTFTPSARIGSWC